MLNLNPIPTLVIALVVCAVGAKYLYSRVESLKEDVKQIQKISDEQSAQIKTLSDDMNKLKVTYDNRQLNRASRDESDAKMTKDSFRKNVVAKKPGLVEKQINASFDKFSQDMQEATR